MEVSASLCCKWATTPPEAGGVAELPADATNCLAAVAATARGEEEESEEERVRESWGKKEG
jgi:hypothetical protein